jgi:hypothetical protein
MADTIPVDTEDSRPRGLPTTIISSPSEGIWVESLRKGKLGSEEGDREGLPLRDKSQARTLVLLSQPGAAVPHVWMRTTAGLMFFTSFTVSSVAMHTVEIITTIRSKAL